MADCDISAVAESESAVKKVLKVVWRLLKYSKEKARELISVHRLLNLQLLQFHMHRATGVLLCSLPLVLKQYKPEKNYLHSEVLTNASTRFMCNYKQNKKVGLQKRK